MSEFILQFVRDVGADDLRKGWSEGFEKNSKDQLPCAEGPHRDVQRLDGGRQIRRAARSSGKPGAGVQVSVNGAVKGTLKGDDFAKAFLSIWLGADPPNPEIKAGMLGGACG